MFGCSGLQRASGVDSYDLSERTCPRIGTTPGGELAFDEGREEKKRAPLKSALRCTHDELVERLWAMFVLTPSLNGFV